MRTSVMQNEVSSALDAYFLERKWSVGSCAECGKEYFSKSGASVCKTYSCAQQYSFLDFPVRKMPLSIADVHTAAVKHFTSKERVHVNSRDVMRDDERTLFASTANQIFDPSIYGGEPPTHASTFCTQPVIRLQLSRSVGDVEGIGTSFLNAATGHWNPTVSNHVEAVDMWIQFLSNQGIYAGDLTIERKYKENLWGEKTVPAQMLKFHYGGLELGVANFFLDIPLPSGASVTLSDVGFGVERIVWAANRTASYFDAIGPVSRALRGDVVGMDTLRTLTLLASSGVVASTRAHGSKFRQLAKKISSQQADLFPMVMHYHQQWSPFLTTVEPLDVVRDTVVAELDRNANAAIAALTGFSGSPDVPTEMYLRDLTRRHISLDALREALRAKGLV